MPVHLYACVCASVVIIVCAQDKTKPGEMLAIVYLDSNKHEFIAVLGHCKNESAESWLFVLKLFFEHFHDTPLDLRGVSSYFSDLGPGFAPAMLDISINRPWYSQRNCVQHREVCLLCYLGCV